MSCDSASFKIRFPEFVSVADARVDVFIDDAIVILNPTYWGEKYDMGICYLTAHFLALGSKSEAGSPGSNGLVAGRTVDGTSVSYTNAIPKNDGDAYYSSTSYGQRYLALRKTLGVAAFSV